MLYLKQILKIISLTGIVNKIIYSKHKKKLISIIILLTFSLYFINKHTGRVDICNIYCTNCNSFYDNVINNNIDQRHNPFLYTQNKVNRDPKNYQKNAYEFALGVESLLKNLTNSNFNFKVITIIPNNCISTTLRYTKNDCNHPMCFYILKRQDNMRHTWNQKNVESLLLIDKNNNNPENNEILQTCQKGIDIYNILKSEYSDIIYTVNNNGYDAFIDANHFHYGIYWFIKFIGDNNVYEFFSSESHQIDYSDKVKLRDSSFSFSKKHVNDFLDEKQNPFIVYLTKNAPKGKLNNFLK